LLDEELQRWNIQVAGLQEVRWLDSGEVSIGDNAFIWSGRNDGKHQEGVALAVQRKLMSACISCRVTTCLENLEMSGNLTVREMSGNLLKIREMSGKNLVREKLPKTT